MSTVYGYIRVSSIDQNEERQRLAMTEHGIEAARRRGVNLGRRAEPLPEDFHQLAHRWLSNAMSLSEAARQCKMPRSTFRYQAEKLRMDEHKLAKKCTFWTGPNLPAD